MTLLFRSIRDTRFERLSYDGAGREKRIGEEAPESRKRMYVHVVTYTIMIFFNFVYINN